MGRTTLVLLWISFICLTGLLLVLNACGGGSTGPTPPSTQQKIQHVVIIFQENRSSDGLFHDPTLMANGADIATTGTNSVGQVITLAPVALDAPYDLGHSHQSWLQMYDNGTMDGADLVYAHCATGSNSCLPPDPQFKYIQASDVAPYFQLAETYTFGDRMFQTNQGPSFPAHQFILSGTSAPTATSDLYVAENPAGATESGGVTGCIAPQDEYVLLIDPTGAESSQIYPCFDHPTLSDLLDAQKISWRYYAPSPGLIWTAPNAIRHICVPNSAGTQCTGADWTNNVVLQPPQVLTDINNGDLATVSWVIPDGKYSDHPSINDGSGPSWVASIVNAIGSSPYWANTAIIITWDDWGGWYDHVAPKIYNSYEYGFRVPLIVVSPYAKAGYVSHVTHDFGSILRFIETNFGLSLVAPTYADARADDLSDCFDFNQTPLNFQTIQAPLGPSHFLEDKRPPVDPDDD
jgi:phospholipase C